ncbi:MAG: hypothetical protein LC114_18045 [Bryobacterales bacterium]|nr:hypothetical protein [Bryobacterales bacterium]
MTYNAAGAMTAFTRNDGSGTSIVNGYTFNHLNQLTNQTVTKGATTLQNLTYTFHATQNNGQILSQTDALSGETVLYQYDALQRLVSAETASNAWGLAWSYDGFGNRTNQSVTKGSAPMHSVAIDAATNRIATAGYQYDANGNLTQMPLMTMGYDVANRMVTSNHSGAGTQSYGYNHANQRVFVRNGDTVTYYLYGLGGERLMEFQETSSVLKASDAAQALKGAFEKWKNCAKVLFNARRRGSLDQKVSSITFIDGRGEGNMGLAGAPNNTTFAEYHTQYPSVVATTLLTRGRGGLTVSTTVVLWSDFFGAVDRGFPRLRADQDATLVHEFIHIEWGRRLASHEEFLSKFGISRMDNEMNQDAIARWIPDDCKQK